MHIPDGILPMGVCAAGYAATAATTYVSLRKINQQENPRAAVPKASLLTAAFFVGSWIHIPIPPTSVHLLLSGLMGVILGWYAFPAILIGLFFQAVMFGHGGLTTLGVNAVIMGLPALAAFGIFSLRKTSGGEERPAKTAILAFLGGAVGVALTVVLGVGLLITFLPANVDPATSRAGVMVLGLAHLPLILVEGIFTMLVVVFLRRVKPELLEMSPIPSGA
jgi:cobalt/nickel transport system permease protein